MPTRRRPRRRGFSLVELLVVVGVLAVLISVLMPALISARKSAGRTICLSRVRQLGLGYQLYTQINHGRSFYCRRSADDFWISLLRPYAGNINATGVCPLTTERAHGWGSAAYCWGPVDGFINNHYGSYGFNGWLYRPEPGGTSLAAMQPLAAGTPDAPINLPARETDRIPVFFDCAWVDAWPDPTDAPGDLRTGGGPLDPTQQMSRVCIARHGRAVNVTFLDGHAETVPLPRLWTLKWSNTFEPRDVTIP